MHNKFPKIFYFIDKFNKDDIKNLDKSIGIIYRNYKNEYSLDLVKKIKKICGYYDNKIYIANNLKLAQKLNLNGVYIPAFNKKLSYRNLNLKKNFLILGSAHNIAEIKIKEKQGCEYIFLSPIFKTNKSKFFLNTVKFNYLSNFTKAKIIALGGINSKNIKKIKSTKASGFASISYIKKNGPKINLGRFK